MTLSHLMHLRGTPKNVFVSRQLRTKRSVPSGCEVSVNAFVRGDDTTELFADVDGEPDMDGAKPMAATGSTAREHNSRLVARLVTT